MKSTLFTPAELEELLAHGDLQRLIDRLLDSPYKQEMAEALTRSQGADAVEEAVSRNLVNLYRGLISRAQGDLRSQVGLFLARWDLAAIKSVIRAKHHGVDAQEALDSLIPGPGLTLPLLQDLASRENIDSIATGIYGWNAGLSRTLTTALVGYQEHADLNLLEEALDRHYFVRNAAELRQSEDANDQMLRLYLSLEIDRINLRTVFQHLLLGAEGELTDRFLPGGTVAPGLLAEMAATRNQAAALERLSATRYAGMVEQIAPLLQEQRFSPVERYLERYIAREIRRLARTDVFGLGVLMDFVWLKYNEVVNIRLIARALAGHLPAARAREELVTG
jgi:V/A-type H+-transporting ATPase subunit C